MLDFLAGNLASVLGVSNVKNVIGTPMDKTSNMQTSHFKFLISLKSRLQFPVAL